MLKLSFAVIYVSIAFICIVKENTAMEENTNNKSTGMKPDIVIEIGDLHESRPSTHPNTENTEAEDKTNDQAPISDTVIQIDNSNESGPSRHSDPESTIQPFEVVASEEIAPTQSPIIYKLPSKLIEVGEKWQLASGSKYSLVTPLCPQLEISHIKIKDFLEEIITTYPDMARCLFVRNFKENESQMCDREPKLVVISKKDEFGSDVICGIKNHQRLIEAQYYNCGSETNVKKYINDAIILWREGHTEAPSYELFRYTMYEICYDFHDHQTLWTKHTPLTPALLANPKSPYKDLSNEFQIEDFDDDASFLDLASSTFRNLKNSYKKTDSRITKVFTMVPKNHMALLYWKKATTHMINSAPLSPEFIPLMKTINNGILQASNKLFVKSETTLEIYTKAETKLGTIMNAAAKIPLGIPAMSYFFPDLSINLFQPNIWYQFVYDKSEKSGVLIVLHNTREQLPEQKVCNENRRMSCEFRSWTDSPEKIIAHTLSNAYCCKMSRDEVKHLFSIRELELEKALDIQGILDSKQIVSLSEEMMLRNL